MNEQLKIPGAITAAELIAQLQEREYGEQFRRMDCLAFGIRDYYTLAAEVNGCPPVDWKILGIEGNHVRIDTELCREEIRCLSDLFGKDNVEHDPAGPGGYYVSVRYPCGHATRWTNRAGDYVAARLRQLTQEAQ